MSYTPDDDYVRDAYALFLYRDPGAGLPFTEGREEFTRWLARHDREVRASAVLALRDEMAQTIASGDVAEVAAPVEGEVGRQEVIDARDELYEDPFEWVEGYLKRAEQSALAWEAEMDFQFRQERIAGIRTAATRIREAHDTWLDISQMDALSFGILMGVRQAVDGISNGLEAYAVELEKENE